MPVGEFAAERVLLPREPPGQLFNAWLRSADSRSRVRARADDGDRERPLGSADGASRERRGGGVFVAEWVGEPMPRRRGGAVRPAAELPDGPRVAVAADRGRERSVAARRLDPRCGKLVDRSVRTEVSCPTIESQTVWIRRRSDLSYGVGSHVGSALTIRPRRDRMEATHTENGQIPLMLIHGAWLSARSWENYADYFAKRGFARVRARVAAQAGRRRGDA